MAGFKTTQDNFEELFTKFNDVLLSELALLREKGKVKASEIDELINRIWVEQGTAEAVYNGLWDLIYLKTRPPFKKTVDTTDEEEINVLLIAFLTSWLSFGKRLPNRIRNTRRIIKGNLYKYAKRGLRQADKMVADGNVNSKILGEGLTQAEKSQYARLKKRSEKKAQEFLEEKTRETLDRGLTNKNVGLNTHYTNRTGQTEALTIRMDLELENAGQDKEIDFITIFVKPNACSICQAFKGVRYDVETAPHLLAHPSCRCDYIIHYVGGQTLIIKGSGRIKLVEKK